jgi:hypothetical protein
MMPSGSTSSGVDQAVPSYLTASPLASTATQNAFNTQETESRVLGSLSVDADHAVPSNVKAFPSLPSCFSPTAAQKLADGHETELKEYEPATFEADHVAPL